MTQGQMRVRSITVKDAARFADSLTNAMTGMGTRRDWRGASSYALTTLDPYTIASAYRGSGLMRKIINIPPLDMCREWRTWMAESDQITLLDNEEKRLKLRNLVRQAEIMRGLGGGCLILGLPGNPSEPAPDPSRIGRGGLAFIHAVSRWQISFTRLEDNALSPFYGEPVEWIINSAGSTMKVHPSRVIAFKGDYSPPITGLGTVEQYWGESKVQQVLDAVTDSDTARGAFASLITKARNTRIGIPDLLNTTATPGGEAAFQRRMELFTMAESMFKATVYDTGHDGQSGEKIDDATYSFGGIKDVMEAFGTWVSAISDIPATRLLGRAPDGMNSSGDGQQKDWNKLVKARQELELQPCLDRLDPYLIASATGKYTPDIWAKFDPLDQPTEKEQADRFNVLMDAVTKLQNTGTIPEIALTKGVQSLLIDGGSLPGLEAALNELPEDERWGVMPDPSEDDLFQQQQEGGDPGSDGSGGASGSDDPAGSSMGDAEA